MWARCRMLSLCEGSDCSPEESQSQAMAMAMAMAMSALPDTGTVVREGLSRCRVCSLF
jgi:hypothetical protein